MDSLEFQVDVNENFINRVRPAQAVTAKLNAYPDWPIAAHVIAMIPTADRSKGTVMVRIGIDEKDPRILPEMGGRVSFLGEQPGADAAAATSAVCLPAAAVQGVQLIGHDDLQFAGFVGGGKLGGGFGGGAEFGASVNHVDLGSDVLECQRPVHGGIAAAGDHHAAAAEILPAADVILHGAG